MTYDLGLDCNRHHWLRTNNQTYISPRTPYEYFVYFFLLIPEICVIGIDYGINIFFRTNEVEFFSFYVFLFCCAVIFFYNFFFSSFIYILNWVLNGWFDVDEIINKIAHRHTCTHVHICCLNSRFEIGRCILYFFFC